MSTKLSKKLLLTSVAACLVMEAAPAMAQLDEIVVFARKREESIMKIPVILTALSAETLDKYALGSVGAIADKVAGLTFSTATNSSGTNVFIRGIGTTTNNASAQSSVALVTDGMQFTQGLSFRASTFDMQQVEVLKGPQALFYGKAAPGGVISIRTADPSDEFEAIARVGYEFEAEEKVGEFVLSGPVTDTLGLRLAAKYSDSDGYFKNKAEVPAGGFVGAPNFGAHAPKHSGFPVEDIVIRGTAVWEPTDTFNARFKATYTKNELQGTGTNTEQVSCPEGNLTAPPLPFGYAPLAGNDCTRNKNVYKPGLFSEAFGDGRPRRNDGDPFNEAEQMWTSLDLNWDVTDALTLSSLTGYYDVDQQNIGEVAAATNVGNIVYVDGEWDQRDITQEFRLTSDYAGPVNFMVGAFYHDGKSVYNIDIPINASFQPLFPGAPKTFGWAEQTVDVEALSLFGQVLWDITPQWELGVGARWTEEDRELEVIQQTDAFYSPTNVLIPVATPKIGSSNWSPEVSLTYTPNDDLTVFANLKQAYKSGSFDTGGSPDVDEEVSFGDERVRGGEIGIKTQMLDGSLQLNVAGYYQKFRDLQVTASSLLSPDNVAVRTLNAAKAKIYGIDMDVTYTPPSVEGLTLFGAVNYNKAEYEEFNNAPCYYGQLSTQGCDTVFTLDALGAGADAFKGQDLKGEPLVQAPEWSANFGFDYERPVFNDMTLRLGSFTTYSSEYSAQIENHWYQDAFFKTSASIGLSGPDDGWAVELIGNNLNDELIVGKCSTNGTTDTFVFGARAPRNGTGTAALGSGGVGETGCALEAGRSVFLRLTVRPSALFAN